MSKPSSGTWHEGLHCNVVSLVYDFRSHTGQLYVLDGECGDMTACVTIFEGIDPKVAAIDTYSGGKSDMTYRKVGGEWHTLIPSGFQGHRA